ncbi:MAG: Holliday junction branch migration protein RuvA [bacterium]|nr:Holliday junction branch migration protein RuvA [bacterium]
MILHLNGTLHSKGNDYVVMDVNGVGYQVFVPETILRTVTVSNTPTTIYTYHHVREDAQILYGFTSMDERQFFVTLTSVSGVGPKVGLKILSAITPTQFVEAIIKENLAVLTSVSGVGKKMAERLILELKDKLPSTYHAEAIATSSTLMKPTPQHDDDLFLAMRTLGYSNEEIKRAYHKAAIELSDQAALDSCIKVMLKHL